MSLSEALPTRAIDTVSEFTRGSATGNCKWRTCPKSLRGGYSKIRTRVIVFRYVSSTRRKASTLPMCHQAPLIIAQLDRGASGGHISKHIYPMAEISLESCVIRRFLNLSLPRLTHQRFKQMHYCYLTSWGHSSEGIYRCACNRCT